MAPYMNWAQTPIMQQDQREQQEALRFVLGLMNGQVNTNWMNMDQQNQLLNLVGRIQQAYPQQASMAYQRYVQPMLGNNMPAQLQNTARQIQAQRAAQMGGDLSGNQDLMMWLGSRPINTDQMMAQSQALSTLFDQYNSNPAYQQAARQFFGNIAPQGNFANLGPQAMLAAANPYMMYASQNQALAQQLFGTPQFPTSAVDQSQEYENAVRALAEAGLASQGQQMTVQGAVRETPTQMVQRIMQSAFGQMVQEAARKVLGDSGAGSATPSSGFGELRKLEGGSTPSPGGSTSGATTMSAKSRNAIIRRIKQTAQGMDYAQFKQWLKQQRQLPADIILQMDNWADRFANNWAAKM